MGSVESLESWLWTEYIEGTKGDDEVEVAKTTSATMTTKTKTTTKLTMIITKTSIPRLSACLGSDVQICRAQRPGRNRPRSAARDKSAVLSGPKQILPRSATR